MESPDTIQGRLGPMRQPRSPAVPTFGFGKCAIATAIQERNQKARGSHRARVSSRTCRQNLHRAKIQGFIFHARCRLQGYSRKSRCAGTPVGASTGARSLFALNDQSGIATVSQKSFLQVVNHYQISSSPMPASLPRKNACAWVDKDETDSYRIALQVSAAAALASLNSNCARSNLPQKSPCRSQSRYVLTTSDLQ